MNENRAELPKSERMLLLFGEALTDLREAEKAKEIPGKLQRAALIFSFERAWFLGLKTLKACLKEEGLSPLTPKQHLELARQAGWIAPEEEDAWWILLMTGLSAAEIYEEEQAEEVKENILSNMGALFRLHETLKTKKQREK